MSSASSKTGYQEVAIKMGLQAIVIAVLILSFLALDYGLRERRTMEARVADKKLVSREKLGDSLFMLILSYDHRVWKARVPRDYFFSVEPGDVLVLTYDVGLLTGHEYNMGLWTAENDIYPIFKAKPIKIQ